MPQRPPSRCRGNRPLRYAILVLACVSPALLALVEAPTAVWQADAADSAAILIADLTGDGQPDILCGRRAGLRLLRRGSDGAFAELANAFSGATDSLTTLVAADSDGDGDLDVFQLNAHGPGRLLRNSGSGLFLAAAELELPQETSAASAAAVADLDGDGAVDLVVGRRGEPALWLRRAGGTFRAATWGAAVTGSAAVAVAAVAVDGDRWPDVVLFDRDAGVAILLNDGTGGFRQALAARPAAPERLRTGAVADVDGDGRADLLGAGATGLFLWLQQTDGSFVDHSVSLPASAVLHILPYDLDRDGDTDLYLACAGQDHVLINDGHGGFVDTPALLPANPGRSFAAAAGDLNGDLAADVALAVPDGPDRLLLGASDAPVVQLEAPVQAVVGRSFSVRVAAADPDGIQSLTLTANGAPLAIAAGQALFSPALPGPVDFVATARDTLGTETVAGPRRTLVAANLPPEVSVGPNLTLFVNEPGQVSGRVGDPGSSAWTGTVDYGDGTAARALAVAGDGRFALSHAYAAAGIFTVVVTITDDGGATGEGTLMATVVNQAPYLSRIQDQSVQDGEVFRQIALDEFVLDPDHADSDIAWTVTDNVVLSVSLSAERVLSITYPPGTACCERLHFTATDPAGATAVRHAFFSVGGSGPDRLAPVALLEADPATVTAGEPAQLRASVEDAGGVITLVRLFGPDGAEVLLVPGGAGVYTASYATSVPGTLDFELVAVDGQGNLFVDAATVTVLVPWRDAPITISLSAPADDATVSAAAAVRGTVQCRDLLEYRLESAPVGETAFTVFATGSNAVVDDELGVFDPVTLPDGLHVIRLTAVNAAGRSAATQITVNVDDRRDIGLFTLSFDDKRVSAGGPRLGITRVYDSRVKKVGDFGVGWSLDLNGISITENRLPASGWAQMNTGYLWPVYDITPTVPHYATVILNQDEMYRYEAMPYPDRGVSWPVRYLDSMDYLPLDGATGNLVASPTPYFTSNGIGAFDIWDQDFRLYKPQNFTYTASNGWTYRFERERYDSLRHKLISYTDPAGVRTSILPGGLLRDDGNSILFHRDAQGRITSVTDPAGAVIQYAYSQRGDLVAVTDETGRTTRFGYDRHHNLLEIIDAAGVRVSRNEYDEQGRLVAVTDGDGHRMEFAHDPEGRREFVRDRRGSRWVFEYDLDGQVTTIIDPQGHSWQYTYDAKGNCLSVLDPEGGRRTWTYDDKNNRLSETSPEGDTATWTYDERGHVLAHTDFRGNAEARTYSVFAGDLLSLTDREGHTTTYTYTSNFSGLLTETDPLGHTTTYTYDDRKRQTSRTDALGRTVHYVYDENGQRTAERMLWTGPGGQVEITRPYTFTANGLPEARGDWNSNLTRYEYDAAGRLGAIVDRLGKRLLLGYAPSGRINARTFADGSSELIEQDGDGNPLAVTDRDGRRTEYEYDGRGLPVRIVLPDGATVRNEYDDAGRRIRTIDPNAHETRFDYDAAGRLRRETAADGSVIAYTYDPNGNLATLTDPNGNVTRYSYDRNDRLLCTTSADGSTETRAYDAVGRLTARTDSAGQTTRLEYDAVGNLVKVTDPLGGQTTAAYDERDALVAVTDAAGRTTHYERDPEGRLLATVLPLGMRETSTYDAEGNRSQHTGFDGQTITFTYDDAYHLAGRVAPGMAPQSFTHTPSGRLLESVDGGGLTTRSYDAAGRLRTLTLPGGGVLAYTYDAAGNLTGLAQPGATVTYAYDAVDRLALAADSRGGSVAYTYDPAGNPTQMTFGNGVVSTRSFDNRNRIARIVDRGPGNVLLADFAYAFNAAGFRAGVVEAHTGRNLAYTYDPLGRLTEERRADAGGVRTTTYAYDAVGNRTSRSDSVEGARTYTYDANDRLLSAGTTTYTYDAAGRRLQASAPGGTTSYAWDALGRLRGVDNGTQEIAYDYDVQGLRTAKSVAGVVTERYVHDPARALPQVVATLDVGGTPRQTFLYGIGPVAMAGSGGSVALHADATLSTRHLTGAAGTVTDSFQFTAFGEAAGRVGTTDCPLLYAGQWREADSGLDYLRARWLDPGAGVLLGRDPAMGLLSAPATRHPYQYALNNPVNAFDPTGRESMGSLMAGMSASSALANMAVSHMTFAILASRIIREVMGPGFALRYGALAIIGTTGNAEVLGHALDMYQKGNLLIAVATDLISLSNTVLSLTDTFVGLGKSVAGMGMISGAKVGIKSAGEAADVSRARLALGFGKAQSFLIDQTNTMGQELKGDPEKLTTSHWERAIYEYVDACRALIHASEGQPGGGE